MAAVLNIFLDYYISACELRIELKMVANGNTHVYDAKDYKKKKKKTWIVTGRCSFGDHLKFQNGWNLYFTMANIFYTFWLISTLLIELKIVATPWGNTHGYKA